MITDTIQPDSARTPLPPQSATSEGIVRAELRQHLPGVAALLALMLLVTLVNVFSPLLYQLLIDDAIPKRDWGQIAWISLGIVAAPITVMALASVQDFFKASIGESVASALRRALFEHVLAGQLIELDRVKTSEIVHRLTRACGQIGTVYVSERLLPLVANAVLLLGYVVVMLAVNWKLALLACLAVPISYLLAQRLTQYAYAVDAEYLHVLENGQSYAQETFAGLRTIRSLGGEPLEKGRWREWLRSHTRTYLKSYVSHNAYLFVSDFINSFLVGLVFVAGAVQIVRGELSLGSLFAFVFYVPGAYAALRVVFRGQIGLGEARAAGDKINRLLAVETEPSGRQPLEAGPDGGLAVEFRDVSFDYGRGDFGLQHLSFSVRPGQFVGIVGASGGGKSTVLDLLLGFYQPQAGEILINGVNLRELSLAALRQQISLVPQDIFLWDASLRENLLYPDRPAQPAEVQAAAQMAQISELIAELPQGYDTVVGERGQNLSGGERQRLAICRSLLRQPRLLLLDEATSALDALTELKLRQAIGQIKQGRTTIVVAHRLATIMQADAILVLDHGRLAESGAPQALIASGGIFSRLYQAQQL